MLLVGPTAQPDICVQLDDALWTATPTVRRAGPAMPAGRLVALQVVARLDRTCRHGVWITQSSQSRSPSSYHWTMAIPAQDLPEHKSLASGS